MNRRAKIAGTLGPACDRTDRLAGMLQAGLDVARINFSHGVAADHLARVRRLRRTGKRLKVNVAVLADLQGPRFRVGMLPAEGLDLQAGTAVVLQAGRARVEPGRIPVVYKALPRDVRRGSIILLDDGNLRLRVRSVREQLVRCEVERGGILTSGKGINLPGATLSVPALTTKDRRDLQSAVEMEADWLAISFVRSPGDVRAARSLLRKAGSDMPVMAKIERPEAIDRLDEILDEADGILVARGDLGVELEPETVPELQKEVIEKANAAGKTVMTATQMLDSMRRSPRPTRAEVSDVANAVLDGTDSLLLTAETAAGDYPVEAVEMMGRIICEAEASGRVLRPELPEPPVSIRESTCMAAVRAAYESGAKYLAVFTMSGASARSVARFKPDTPILAYTPRPEVQRRLAVQWGVTAVLSPELYSSRDLLNHLEKALLKDRHVSRGDLVVVVSGFPVGVAGTTNLVAVHKVRG
jgi:pyruvate kinase